MTEQPHNRWRHPDASALVLILSVVVGLVVVVTTFLSIWGYFRLNDQALAIRGSRYSASYATCNAQAALSRTANEQTRLYENLIVTGARGSRIFEPFFRRYRAPAYGKRLRDALKSAQDIEKLLLAVPDCKRFAALVRDQRNIRVVPSVPPCPKIAVPAGVRPNIGPRVVRGGPYRCAPS